LAVYFQEVTEQKQAEEALRHSEERHRSLISVLTSLVWTVDGQGKFVCPQPTWQTYTGQTWPESKDWGWLQALHADDREQVKAQWIQARDRQTAYQSQGRIWHAASQQYRYFEAVGVPLLNADGAVREWVNSITDVDDRKQAEEARQARHRFVQQLADLAPGLLYLFDAIEQRNIYINPRSLDLLGYSPETILAMGANFMAQVMHPDDLAQIPAHFERMNKAPEGDFCDIQYRMRHINGEWRWFHSRDRVFSRTAAGQIHQVLGTAEDITERQQAEEALRESEERFQAFMNYSPASAWIADQAGRLLYLSPTYFRMFQFPQQDAVGKSIFDIYPEEFAQQFLENNQRVLETKQVFETIETAPRPDGSVGDFLVYKFPIISSAEETLLGGVAVDITQRRQAEAALKESEERFRKFFAEAPIGISVIDLKGKFLQANKTYCQMLGYSEPELCQLTFAEITHPEDVEADLAYVQQVFKGEISSYQIEKRYFRKNRQIVWVNLTGTAIFDRQGQLRCGLAMVEDISDRKQEERRQAAQSAVIRVLAEATTLVSAVPAILQSLCENLGWQLGVIWNVDHEHNVLRYVNSWQEATTNRQAFIAVNQQTTFGPGTGLPGQIWLSHQPTWISDLSQATNFLRSLSAGREGLQAVFGFPILLADEILGVIECFSDRIQEPDADLLQMMAAIGSQIGQFMERKRTEEALRESQALFQSFMSHSPVTAYIKDGAGHYLYVNALIEQLWQTSLADVVGKTDSDFLPPEAAQQVRANDAAVLANNQAVQVMETLHLEDGEHYYMSFKFPLQDGSGQRLLAGMSIDISDRIQAEAALRASAERLNLAMAASRMGDWSWDIATDRVSGSEQAAQIFGMPSGAAMSWTQMQNLIQAEDRERARLAVERALCEHNDYDIEYRVSHPDGELRWIAVKGRAQYDASGKALGILGVVQDITDRKRNEVEIALLNRDLQNRVNELQTLFEVVPIGILITDDPEFKYVRANPALAQILGISAHGNASSTPPVGSPLPSYKIFHNGKELTPEETPLRYAAIHGVEVKQTEVDILRQDGELFNLYGYAAPLFNQQGKVRGAVGAFLDITNRKQAEAEREQLLERERIARAAAEAANRVKDEFLAVLSHELRSPLNPILGWARLLRTRQFDQQAIERALETIERNAKLQAQLIEDLLDISRILQGKLNLNICPVDLASTITAAIETVQLSAEAKLIQIQTQFEPQIGQVLGDSNRLQQVVWNLLSNAVKFTPEGGQIAIQLERLGSQAQITVRDTGKGISPEFLPYVFDYFRQADSTTTRKFGGLGLGLAIVRHLVDLHGGTVQADSPGEGQGATFTIRLSLMAVPPEVNPNDQQPQETTSLKGVRVLVVDDDPDTRELVAVLLEQYGATVIVTASATEALQALNQSSPDLLLSDIGMPEMDGYMLMQRVRKLAIAQGGQIPAIALTAYAGELNQQQALAAGFQMHMPKPVDPEALVQAIACLRRRNLRSG
jgi:PAS domain S-box-containing protein